MNLTQEKLRRVIESRLGKVPDKDWKDSNDVMNAVVLAERKVGIKTSERKKIKYVLTMIKVFRR